MFKKARHKEEGSHVHISVRTIYYIVAKVFSCKKKLKIIYVFVINNGK